jgi:flagellar biosynthesis chaperone FliJ
MLRQMQQSGATAQQISTAMTNMQQQMSTANALTKVEDNVDTLLQKLEGQGKKVKILTEEEEERARQEKEIKDREMKQKMEELLQLQEEKQAMQKDQENIA